MSVLSLVMCGTKDSVCTAVRKVAEVSNPGEIEIWNDGKQTKSFLYIDDGF